MVTLAVLPGGEVDEETENIFRAAEAEFWGRRILPMEMIAEIAGMDPVAYARITETCRAWRRAVQRRWPKMKAVAKFTQRVVEGPEEIDGRMVTKKYSLLPNGKKNGLWRTTVKKDDKLVIRERFYLNGAQLTSTYRRTVGEEIEYAWYCSGDKVHTADKLHPRLEYLNIWIDDNYYLVSYSGERFVRVFCESIGDIYRYFREFETGSGYVLNAEIYDNNAGVSIAESEKEWKTPPLDKIMEDAAWREEVVQMTIQEAGL